MRYTFGDVQVPDENNTRLENVGIVNTPSALIEFIEDHEHGQHNNPHAYLGKDLSQRIFAATLAYGFSDLEEETLKPVRLLQDAVSIIPGVGKIASILIDKQLPKNNLKDMVNSIFPNRIMETIMKNPLKFYSKDNDIVGALLTLGKH